MKYCMMYKDCTKGKHILK